MPILFTIGMGKTCEEVPVHTEIYFSILMAVK
jgi:hypothetical protein